MLDPPAALQNVRVVLLSPKLTSSLGGCARTLSCFECMELVVVAPRVSVQQKRCVNDSKGAAYILQNARVVDTLNDALTGCSFSAAFTRWTASALLHIRAGYDLAWAKYTGTLKPTILAR